MLSKAILFVGILLFGAFGLSAQIAPRQQGLLLKSGTAIRLGSVQILNKRTRDRAWSGTTGVFAIPAVAGDTINFTSDNFQPVDFVVTDLSDKIIYLQAAIQLNEVVIKENSIKTDIKEVMRGYREKSVFYNGSPHYYYLVLKPMTFIYENFKSEKIFARRFDKYAKRELADYEISARFNDATIKAVVPITDSEMEAFKLTYAPKLEKLRKMSDYDMVDYIRNCYADFKKNAVNKNATGL